MGGTSRWAVNRSTSGSARGALARFVHGAQLTSTAEVRASPEAKASARPRGEPSVTTGSSDPARGGIGSIMTAPTQARRARHGTDR